MDDMFAGMMGMTAVITVVSIGAAIIPLFFVFRLLRGLSQAGQANRQLLMIGLPGQAQVVSMGVGGMRVSQGIQASTQMQLSLNVQPPMTPGMTAAPPIYPVMLTAMVPDIAMATIQPGRVILVKIDPSNPMNVAIDFPSMGFAV